MYSIKRYGAIRRWTYIFLNDAQNFTNEISFLVCQPPYTQIREYMTLCLSTIDFLQCLYFTSTFILYIFYIGESIKIIL